MAAPKIALRKIEDLTPDPRNARTHSPEQIEELAGAIDRFGYTVPGVHDEKDVVRIGNGRLAAVRLIYERGGTVYLAPGQANGGKAIPAGTIPIMDGSGYSEDEWKALALGDNQLALRAGWDIEQLAAQLDELAAADFSIAMIGFDQSALEALALGATEPKGNADPDEVPAILANPVSRLGDVWLLGEHRIICGDCTDPEATAKVQTGDEAVIVSDPPYGLGYEYEEHDDSDNEANAKLVADAFALGPGVLIWTPGLNNLARDLNRFGRTKVLVWNKRFAAAGNGMGGASTWEPILIVGPTPARRLKNDVLEVMTEREFLEGESLRKLHSCPKPVALYQQLLEALTDKGQVIYEPFSGSGTTLIAAERCGRKVRAVELTPAYVDVAVMRWQAYAGKEATLEGDGRTFAEVSHERLGPVFE